jgi:hypothetical protein
MFKGELKPGVGITVDELYTKMVPIPPTKTPVLSSASPDYRTRASRTFSTPPALIKTPQQTSTTQPITTRTDIVRASSLQPSSLSLSVPSSPNVSIESKGHSPLGKEMKLSPMAPTPPPRKSPRAIEIPKIDFATIPQIPDVPPPPSPIAAVNKRMSALNLSSSKVPLPAPLASVPPPRPQRRVSVAVRVETLQGRVPLNQPKSP